MGSYLNLEVGKSDNGFTFEFGVGNDYRSAGTAQSCILYYNGSHFRLLFQADKLKVPHYTWALGSYDAAITLRAVFLLKEKGKFSPVN